MFVVGRGKTNWASDVLREELTLTELMKVQPSEVNKSEAADLTDGKGCGDKDWYGAPFKELDGLLLNGWPEGLKRVEAIMEKVRRKAVPHARSRKRKRTRLDMGDDIDLDRFRSGQLDDCWWSMLRKVGRGKPIISIATRIGFLCDRKADDFLYQGAAALLLTDILEEAGYKVEVYGYAVSRGVWKGGGGSPLKGVLRVPFKLPSEPLDKTRLVSLLGLAGLFRKWGFLWFYSQPWECEGGLGTTEETTACAKDAGADIILDDITTEERVVEMLVDVIEHLNRNELTLYGREK